MELYSILVIFTYHYHFPVTGEFVEKAIKCSNNRLDYWYLQDADLRNDLQEEQLIINKIFDIYQPKFWFFGHYHDNKNIGPREILIYEQIIRIL